MAKDQETEKGKVRLGTAQWGKPTPAGVSRLLDMIVVFSGVLAAYLGMDNHIPKAFSDIASPILTGFIIPLCVGLKPFFGVSIKGLSDIPAEQVTEMKNP